MDIIKIYEEIFFNTMPTPYKSFHHGFIMNYGGLYPFTNSVHSIYVQEFNSQKRVLSYINDTLIKRKEHPIYRIVSIDNYAQLDRMLSSMNFDKIFPFEVMISDLNSKKELLFQFASFYENGVFIDKNINSQNHSWLDNYFFLNDMKGEEKELFLDMIDLTLYPNYGFTFVQENTLIGSGYCVKYENIMFLQNISINPKYQALGYGSKLLMSVMTFALKEGCNFLMLQAPVLSNGKESKIFSSKYFDTLYVGHYRALA